MPTSRSLVTLLRSLQIYTDQQNALRCLSIAISLFTTLGNPLNLSLLTSQILRAPAIWQQPDGLQTCFRVMNAFQSTAFAMLRAAEERASALRDQKHIPFQEDDSMSVVLSRAEWVRAVMEGADERLPAWRHSLVLSGLLMGFEGQDRGGLPKALRSKLERSLVDVINQAAKKARSGEELGAHCITLVLNYTFELLSENERSRLDYNLLLPILMGTAFFSEEGFQAGNFLESINADVKQNQGSNGSRFCWPDQSHSFARLSGLTSRPLFTSMGPLSRLIAHTVENVSDSWLVRATIEDLVDFSRTVVLQWRNTKISEADASEEDAFFDQLTRQKTLPTLWKVLRSALFATAIVLRSVVGRVLRDANLAAHEAAALIATQSLHTLRNLSFISLRLGAASFSQYTFVYLTSIDILSAYPNQAAALMQDISPSNLGQIPANPLDRSLDLFFLNTAEYFALILPAEMSETHLIPAALPYFAAGGNNHLLEIFEAAHSVMLAVLSSPQSANLAADHLPFYIEALFKVFPRNLSPRQFRLAFKTLLSISTGLSPLTANHPYLAETLLELLHDRAKRTPQASSISSTVARQAPRIDTLDDDLDERTVLTLTLVDSLPFLPPPLLMDWLPVVASLVPELRANTARETCTERLWEVMTGGEMDIERSQICVAWWGTRGGREMVLGRDHVLSPKVEMSGALKGGTEAPGDLT